MPSAPPSGSILLAELPEPEAWRILRESALTYHRPRLEAIPEVASVTLGLKETGGQPSIPREPCLVVHVHRKGSAVRSEEVEPWHTVSTAEHGRVAFRTDVLDVGFAATGANLVPSPFLDASRDGSACCLLNMDGHDFLLSAAHVLDGPIPQLHVTWAKPGLPIGRGDFITRPGTYWFQKQDAGNRMWGVVDSGLALVRDAGLYADWKLAPWGSGLVRLHEVNELGLVLICGARSRLVEGRFSSWLPTGFAVTEAGWRTHRYWRVALFRFTDPSRTTVDGDSGCPVFATDQRLVGMHVGTYRSQGTVYSMVLSIADLLVIYRDLLGSGLQVKLPAVPPS